MDIKTDKMRVLHISNGFAGSKVHSNLAKKIDDRDVCQVVYCPVRTEREMGGNQFEGKNIEFVYSNCIKSWYKFVYHYKAWRLYKDMRNNVDMQQVDFIHAHTLFSDGLLAYKAYKEYGIPYAVAVRNTDLNYFIRLLKHTYPIGRKILINASKVFFISAGIMRMFSKTCFVRPIIDQVKGRFELLPNGIDDYWHQHISTKHHAGHDILYVGDFSDNKNLVTLANAVMQLRQEKGFEDVRLVIVGGDKGEDRMSKTRKMIEDNPEAIVYLGKIFDKGRLSDVMDSCAMFAMVSIYETFGLVYVEALSQNLPVVFTKGQGIDGMFDNTVGIGVNPLSVEEIRSAIREILSNPGKYGNGNVNFDDFNWGNIAEKYIDIYSYCSHK